MCGRLRRRHRGGLGVVNAWKLSGAEHRRTFAPEAATEARSAHNPSSRRLVLHRESLARAQRWETMPLAEFPAAMQALAGDIDNSDTILGLLEVWARRHPEGYARFLVEHGTGLVMARSRHSLDLTGPLMRHLIKENPQAAVDLIDRLAGIGEHNLWSLVASLRLAAPEHMPYLLSRLRDRLSVENPGEGWWAGSDPLTLVSLTHQLKPGPTLTNLLRDGLAHYLERSDANVTQAGTWLAQLPAESQASVIDQLCRAHPREVKPERCAPWPPRWESRKAG